MASDKAEIIRSLCEAIANNDDAIIANDLKRYPFVDLSNTGRHYNEMLATRIFVRDGYIDRYSGERLVNPAVLRILSKLFPREFPFHPNWKMAKTHPAYWELFPTVDHVVPVARGGSDNEENWVTTSMLRNSGKSNWTIEELGWKLLPPGDFSRWDGLTGWLFQYIERHSLENQDRYVVQWFKAAKKLAV